MPQIDFNIKIAPTELEKYYAGHAKSVSVIANNGQRLQFPANLMLPHVSHSGICGEFRLEYSDAGKALSLIKVDKMSTESHFSKQV